MKKELKCEVIYQDFLNCRVCSNGSWDETLEWVRKNCPAGTENNWQKKEGILDAGKNAAPVECGNGNGMMHYMFIC